MAAQSSRRWSAARIRRIKPLLWMVGLYPLLRWFYLGLHDALTANPPEFLIRSSGLWALIFLWLTLSISPLARALHQPALVVVRRLLGLFCFFYTLLHGAAWAQWECGLSIYRMAMDIAQRPFIFIGTVATALLLALALTSTRQAMRRLGGRWKTLHRSIYVIALLSLWHYWLVKEGKQDFRLPIYHASLFAALMLERLLRRWMQTSIKLQ